MAARTRKTAEPSVKRGASRPKRSRDPEGTRTAILEAARTEFCQHGFDGARVEQISRRSKTNMRMIYHYFGNKEGVYLAVLESVYGDIRKREQQLDLAHADPIEGITRLIQFTFDFFSHRQNFLALISTENLLKAKYLKRLPSVQAMMVPLIESIRDLLERGEQKGVFRPGTDPVQFYVSLVAQSQLHILSRHTLSVIFNKDLTDAEWLSERRQCTMDMLLAYLTTNTSVRYGAGHQISKA